MKTFNCLVISIVCCFSTAVKVSASSQNTKTITSSKRSISPSDVYELACQHHRIGEFDKAFKYATVAANSKNAKGQSLLAFMYLYGQGVEKDNTKAKHFYQLAADQGHAPAQLKLGLMYEDEGDEKIQSLNQAYKYFKLSADNGNADAQCIVAIWNAKGKAVSKNYSDALKYAKLAAKKNIPEAYGLLGMIYEHGLGVPADYNLATRYYKLEASYKNQSR